MSRDEARFWLESMLISRMDSRNLTPKQKADELSKKKLGPASLVDVKKAIKANAGDYPPEIGHVLLPLFPAIEIVELLLEGRPHTAGFDGGGTFLDGIRDLVVPRLTDADRAKLKARIAPAIKPKNFLPDFYEEPSGEFILAAMLGLHDELLPVVESWADDRYSPTSWDHTAYHVPQVIVFGLGSAALVETHVRRMNLPLNKAQYMRAWLAHTEYAGLDYAAKVVVETKNKALAAELAEIVALVHAPQMPARCSRSRRAPRLPRSARSGFRRTSSTPSWGSSLSPQDVALSPRPLLLASQISSVQVTARSSIARQRARAAARSSRRSRRRSRTSQWRRAERPSARRTSCS